MKLTVVFFVAACVVFQAFAVFALVPDDDDSRISGCAKAMDKYLKGRLGDEAVDKEREGLQKGLYDGCEEFLIDDKGKDKGVDGGDPEKGLEQLMPKPYNIDGDRVDARLKSLGLIVGGEHFVVVLASELIGDDWIESSFTSPDFLSAGLSTPNECESTVAEEMLRKGFLRKTGQVGDGDRMRAKSFRSVVGRYRDLSSMPNFSSIKAAGIIDDQVSAVIGCGISVDVKGHGGSFKSCARGKCKAVDVDSRLRVATASGVACRRSDDESTANAAAIRDVCGGMGRSIGDDLLSLFSKRDNARAK